MAPKKSLLEKMRANPKGDWTIQQVCTVCDQLDIEVRKPNGSSHYVVVSAFLRDALCVPYKRPIRVIYIKHFVSYCDAHKSAKEESNG